VLPSYVIVVEILTMDGDRHLVVALVDIGIQRRLYVKVVILAVGAYPIIIIVVIMQVLMVNLTPMVTVVFTVLVSLTLELSKVLIH
jgi:hypothetical protein